jgi:cycloartenol synthase
MIQNILWGFLDNVGEPLLMHWPYSKLRNKALNHVMKHIHFEDQNSNYICIGPVNKVITLIIYIISLPYIPFLKLIL